MYSYSSWYLIRILFSCLANSPLALFSGGQNFEWQQWQQQQQQQEQELERYPDGSICFLLLGRLTRYRLNCNISYRSRSLFQSSLWPSLSQAACLPAACLAACRLYFDQIVCICGLCVRDMDVRSTGMPACLTISFKMLQDMASSCTRTASH